MLKNELKKINKEYEELKRIESSVLFSCHKGFIYFSMFAMPIFFALSWLFASFLITVEIPFNIKNGESLILTYFFICISFVILFFSLHFSYSGWYYFFKHQFSKNKSKHNYNSFCEYENEIENKKKRAKEILHTLKNGQKG